MKKYLFILGVIMALSGLTSKSHAKYYPVDISKACNMGFADDVADDKKGGWLDQGPGSDFRLMPLGSQEEYGIKFEIIDPKKNGGKSCLVLKGTARPYFPEKAQITGINRKAKVIYFLQSCGWEIRSSTIVVASYKITYKDNTSSDVPLHCGIELTDWAHPESTEKTVAAFKQDYRGITIGLNLFSWANPYPDKEISSITFESKNEETIPILVAVTLSEQESQMPSRKTKLPEGINKSPGYKVTGKANLKASGNIINVFDFGAAGDGKKDDTAAIQKALDYAAGLHATVFVPSGVYLCSTLRLPSSISFTGSANFTYRQDGGSVIKLNDERASCLLDATNSYGLTIHGLCLEGANLGKNIHGIMVDKMNYGNSENNLRIENCKVSDFTGDGIHLGRIFVYHIRHAMTAHNKGHGIYVNGWDGFVLDCLISGNAKAGFYGAPEGNAAITITANRIEWNGMGGIVICGGNQINITGNYIDRSGGPGIYLTPGTDRPCNGLSITGNVIYRSGRPGSCKPGSYESSQVRFEKVKGMVFTGNAMNAGRDDNEKGEWSPDYGIVYGGLKNCVIKDNVLNDGALKKIIVDLGGNDTNSIVKDNVGSILVP